MKKKKEFPDDKRMNALDDTRIYGAGHEGDETLNDDEIHTNGGIPDESGEDTDDEDDDDESDDNRA